MTRSLLFLSLIPFVTACQNPIEKAARQTAYSAYEMMGVQKRDLLKKRVDEARDDEKDASKSFKTALERLKDLYGFNGGKLESQYDGLKSSYDKASDQSQDVHNSIRKVETVAQDLFDEWEKEIDELHTPELKDRSRRTLVRTREKYSEMHSSLKRSEDQMQPVLLKFKDQVIFLKHNLNAQAIGSLKKESRSIQRDVENLIQEMSKSIAAADQLIKTMD